jgi:hypothetical protein
VPARHAGDRLGRASYIHDATAPTRVVRGAESLTDEKLLPGFALPLNLIFPELSNLRLAAGVQLLRALQDAVSDAVDRVGDVRDGSVVCSHDKASPSVVTRLLPSLLADSGISRSKSEVHGKVEHEDDTYEHKADHESTGVVKRVHG